MILQNLNWIIRSQGQFQRSQAATRSISKVIRYCTSYSLPLPHQTTSCCTDKGMHLNVHAVLVELWREVPKGATLIKLNDDYGTWCDNASGINSYTLNSHVQETALMIVFGNWTYFEAGVLLYSLHSHTNCLHIKDRTGQPVLRRSPGVNDANGEPWSSDTASLLVSLTAPASIRVKQWNESILASLSTVNQISGCLSEKEWREFTYAHI